MSDKPDIHAGDWVRFYSGGKLVLGIVAYLRKPETYPYEWEALTDVGSVRCEHILELRRTRTEEFRS